MPWNQSSAMEQRMKFILEWQAGLESKAELCRRYGISRRIGYLWAERYDREGPSGLEKRSSAAKTHPNQTPPEVVERVLEVRRAHPLWGAPKIQAVLSRDAEFNCPAQSTIGAILRDAGLTRERKKRRRTPPHTQPLAHAGAPNDVVSIDFKGWFRCRNGQRIDPLTIIDNHSRYLLCCQAVDACDCEHVQALLERMFRDYGLPRSIRSDNGAPFATGAPAGLSRLSLWWLKLGIAVERTAPATPSENGRQERFHRTLKLHTANPPAQNQRAQQQAFRDFRCEYNQERPHQALGQRPPSSVYEASPRPYPSRIAAPEYPWSWPLRKVHKSGSLDWRGREVFLSKVLWGEQVGLEPIDDGVFHVWFGPLALGRLDGRRAKFAPFPLRRGNGPCGASSGHDAATNQTSVESSDS